MFFPASSVTVHPLFGAARFRANNVNVRDFTDLENAVLMGPSVPAKVSFDVRWNANSSFQHVDNPAQQYRSTFRTATAQISYECEVGDYEITSAPLSQSTSAAAQFGVESNGYYY